MKIYVNKDKVEFEDKQVILSGAINSYTADVYFDESWDGLTKEAIIVKNKEDVGTEHYITTNTVTFDIEKTGFYQIGFKGYTVNENNEKVYQAVTNLEMFPVLKGSGEIDGIKPELPKATEWEIYLQQIEEMVTGLSKLPKGGNTNQALVKNSDLDYDMSWQYVEGGGAGGGTSDYEKLENLPSINRIKLIGNKTTEDLGILEDVENYVDKHKDELKGDTGPRGEAGKDGYTPVKGVDYFDGVNGVDGYTPIKGTDYYTEADKEEIVNLVLEALPNSEEVEY